MTEHIEKEQIKKISIRSMSVIHTYPASVISRKYRLTVKEVRKLKFGGVIEVTPAIASELEADGIIRIVKKKSQEK